MLPVCSWEARVSTASSQVPLALLLGGVQLGFGITETERNEGWTRFSAICCGRGATDDGRAGWFDLDERYAALSAVGDPLERPRRWALGEGRLSFMRFAELTLEYRVSDAKTIVFPKLSVIEMSWFDGPY